MKEKDITADPVWQKEQVDRLLGWELLRRSLLCEMHGMEIQELCDRIGVNKGYVHKVLTSARQKLIHD